MLDWIILVIFSIFIFYHLRILSEIKNGLEDIRKRIRIIYGDEECLKKIKENEKEAIDELLKQNKIS